MVLHNEVFEHSVLLNWCGLINSPRRFDASWQIKICLLSLHFYSTNTLKWNFTCYCNLAWFHFSTFQHNLNFSHASVFRSVFIDDEWMHLYKCKPHQMLQKKNYLHCSFFLHEPQNWFWLTIRMIYLYRLPLYSKEQKMEEMCLKVGSLRSHLVTRNC